MKREVGQGAMEVRVMVTGERETTRDASSGGGGETGSGRVGCSCYTDERIAYAERHTVDGGGDYCYAFWRVFTSMSWRCITITTIVVAAYCIYLSFVVLDLMWHLRKTYSTLDLPLHPSMLTCQISGRNFFQVGDDVTIRTSKVCAFQSYDLISFLLILFGTFLMF
ncbi:hypothetical protein Hanom_Chr06g00485081 [Helianthus anomalus]